MACSSRDASFATARVEPRTASSSKTRTNFLCSCMRDCPFNSFNFSFPHPDASSIAGIDSQGKEPGRGAGLSRCCGRTVQYRSEHGYNIRGRWRDVDTGPPVQLVAEILAVANHVGRISGDSPDRPDVASDNIVRRRSASVARYSPHDSCVLA